MSAAARWPALTPAARILLLCAREELNPAQAQQLSALCPAVTAWPSLIRQADELRVLPLVHRHLRATAAAGAEVPRDVLAELALRSRARVLENLRTADVHLRLVRDVLTPLDVPHVFVKGTTLAHRWYRDPNLRVSRDVDVLVPAAALEPIAHRLRDLGYTAAPGAFGSDDGIRYAARVMRIVNWWTPDGVLIEVHSRLKLEAGRLETARLLADPAHVMVAGEPLRTLHESDAIAHACHHHARSRFARLHWVADLDVMLRAHDGDAEALIAAAASRGFGKVAASAFALHRVLASTDPLHELQHRPPRDALARQLLQRCLAAVSGDERSADSRATSSRRAHAGTTDLPELQRWTLRLHARLVQPLQRQSTDFLHLPMPSRWHLLYLVLRPFLWALRRAGCAPRHMRALESARASGGTRGVTSAHGRVAADRDVA